MIKRFKKGVSTQLSANFRSVEFDCHGVGCCDETLVDMQLVEYLQKIRDHFGKPIIISSGYRCERHNRSVGGATASKHKAGMAADIMISGVAPSEVAKYAESIGVKGIGLYETAKDGYFVHIDTRVTKSFWYGQGQAYRSTFGGAPVDNASYKSISVLRWQNAAIQDGFKFPKYGADGAWGAECETVAKQAICKKRVGWYRYKNLTKIIQEVIGVTADGKFGNDTRAAVIKWQAANGLVADGAVGLNSWKRILGIS